MSKLSGYFSVLIVSTIVVLTCWQSYTVAHFYFNQDEIEAEFCENLDQPELDCHGQCHLKKQLGEKTLKVDKKSKTIQSSLLVFQAFELINNLQFSKAEGSSFSFNFLNSLNDGASSTLLDPPESIS